MSARRFIVLAAVLCGVAGVAWFGFRDASEGAGGDRAETGVASATAATPARVSTPDSRPASASPAKAGTPMGNADASQVAASGKRPVITDWRHAFDQGGDVVDAFSAAARAAEAGDSRALRAVHFHVGLCQKYFGIAHQPWMDLPGPHEVGGIEQIYPDERCALIARAPEFAADTPGAEKLTPEYWERVAQRVDEPLSVSYRVADTLAQLDKAPADAKPGLKSSIAADVRHILQSRDATAWFELGSRAIAPGANADPSYGIALTLAACDLGYDCVIPGGNGTVTQTYQQRWKQSLPADMYEQGMARYSELRELMRAGDWAAVENFLPMDGTAFK